ncbi:MAG: ribosome-associated translation inhibitor RaiA [Candidatus Kerfeldbacteria bacterium]|nr:ribosome-associated translation inhibitor RaiA [Candidatus Kerfeldbacteria bacterium]
MEIVITGKDFKLTPSIKTYVQEHAAKLGHVRQDIEMARFELDVERHHKKGPNYRVEGWVFAPGVSIAAGDHAFEMHAAIDGTIEKLLEQLRRKKGKELVRRKQRSEE